MLIEKLIFNMLAFALFVIMFFKMIRKNDANYVTMLAIQAIGIAINFIEILFTIQIALALKILIYILSIVLPIIVLLIEKKGMNFTEILYGFLGLVSLSINNNKQAKKFFIKIISKYPNSYFAHKKLAIIYEKEGGQRRALEEYIKAVEIKKDDYESCYKISVLLNDLNKKEEAINVLEDLLKKQPKKIEATILLGDILCEKDRQKEALSYYMDALKYNPNSYDLYYNMGMTYVMLNDFNNAKICYQRAANINSLLYNAYYNLGQISMISGDLEEAEKYFSQCLLGEDVEADGYYKLSKIYMLNKDRENAIKFINIAIELDKEYIRIVNEEPIFIPIKSLIRYPVIDDEDIEPKETKLTKKEIKVKKHLEEIYQISGKLSYNEIKIRNEKTNRIQKERDE